jgi:hypothetical protein
MMQPFIFCTPFWGCKKRPRGYRWFLRLSKKKQFMTALEKTWGGRIRTYEWRCQKPLPCHLATPHLNLYTVIYILLLMKIFVNFLL